MLSRPEISQDQALTLQQRRAIDEACDRFEAAWRSGDRPDLLTFFDGEVETPLDQLFEEILALEFALRVEEGERPDPGDYSGRFPEYLTAIERVFTPVVSFQTTLDSPPQQPWTVAESLESSEDYEAAVAEAFAGDGYEILGVLGRGGMGVVYEARQVALGRVVALKVLRGSPFANETMQRRFRKEAESVARLDHPHIVPIYEVGKVGGLDFFSMKRVQGAGLDASLARYSGEPQACSRLVATAAEAIHHAHQRGILHRDLKPANILVDDQGEPHVTDFGLARDVEFSAGLTRTGLLVGTPAFMAPEQAEGTKGGVTTATYGLGAVLYALLTGRAPHIGDSLFETLEKVRRGPPEAPSRLDPRVPRDLDVICLKCLETDPLRRYESSQALADDLRRWLRGEPITARPVGRGVRLALWCRRNPLPSVLAAALAVAAVTGVAGVTWKWREAEREAATSTEVIGALRRIFTTPANVTRPDRESVTVRELLDRESAQIGSHFQGRPRVEAAVREAIGDAYLGFGEPPLALPHFQEAARMHRERLGADHPTTLHAATRFIVALTGVGRTEEAEALARRTLQASDRACGPSSPTSIEAADELGWLLRNGGRFLEAEPFLRRALADRRRCLPPDHLDTLRSVQRLCHLDLDLGKYDEAEPLAYEYEHSVRCAFGPKHPENIVALKDRGRVSWLRGRPAEAELYHRRAVDEARRIFGPGHPTTVSAEEDLDRMVVAAREKNSVVKGTNPSGL
jgi:eukaryotic-like serine/threonine-protein kinase